MKQYNPYLTFTFFLTLFYFSLPTFLSAQPENDYCYNNIRITDVVNSCSAIGAYTNENATPTNFSEDTGISTNGKDVWFLFTAIASDVTIIIRGEGEGGTLYRPEAQFFGNNECLDTFTILPGSEVSNNNLVELRRGGLIPGTSYLFRVQGENGTEGTFQICINNFFPPETSGSDLEVASMLCGKSSFHIETLSGTGEDKDEARGTCLDGGSFRDSERNSTWFTWIADNNGTLEFTLTPSNPNDDIDFVVFEFPNGLTNSSDQKILRCMATACKGPTGLNIGSTDLEEDPGCDVGDDGFLQALDMEAGVAYGLLINNFHSSNGVTVDFGGTGEFRTPEPVVEIIVNNQVIESAIICAGEQLSFSGANSSFAIGNIVEYDWIFGVGATPKTAKGVNPPPVTYDEPGEKFVVLTITTDLGCKVSEIHESTVTVLSCCDLNKIEGEGTVTNLVCGRPLGAIDFTATSDSRITHYEWNTGATVANLTSLEEGEYIVTVTNLATCTATYSFPIKEVPPFTFDAILTNPQCGDGTDGSIELSSTAENPIIAWSDGVNIGTKAENLSVGTYSVTIEDANGCLEQDTFELKEVVLDPIVAAITAPTCFEATNGLIEVTIANGTAPYEYNWNDGQGFLDATSLTNLGANAYAVQVKDANGCEGDFQFVLAQPPALTVVLETTNASCEGWEDGAITATASGGTGDYTYQWNTNQTAAILTELAAGTYSLTVVDEQQCEITDFATINLTSEVSVAVEDVQDVLCHGEATGSISVNGTGGNPPYEYSINGSPFQMSPALTGLNLGTYIINIRDQTGCVSRVEATVNEPAVLQVRIAAEAETIKLGKSTSLTTVLEPVSEEVEYDWWPSAIIDCPTCPDTKVTPARNTSIQLTVTNSNNCIATDSLFLIVQPNRDLFIPTAFSPSLDGFNDRFTLYGSGATQDILLLRIYNRWGNQIFEATNIPIGDASFGWDGQFNGQDVPTGVFIYHAVVRFIDGEEVEYGGDITLVR